MQWFETLGRQILARQPDPPRQVPRLVLLRQWTQGAFIAVILLLIVALLSMPYMSATYGWTGLRSLRTYIGVGGILIIVITIISGPIIRYLTLRSGVVRVIRVIKITSRSTERLAPAFVGECTHPLNPAVSQTMRFDSTWAAALHVGDAIDVIIYPPQRAWFVFALGVAQPDPPPKRKR